MKKDDEDDDIDVDAYMKQLFLQLNTKKFKHLFLCIGQNCVDGDDDHGGCEGIIWKVSPYPEWFNI